MAKFLNLPTLEADFLAPLRTSVDVMGSSVDGGRSGTGETIEIQMSGGGALSSTYEECKITEPEQFEYINWLGARLTGGFRFINVPIITDWWGPFAGKRPTIGGIPHSDGAYFSDGSGYSQATVYGELVQSAGLNAGIIKMRVYGLSRPLRWSDWFSIYHETAKGWRAYRYWDVLDVTSETNPVYTLALSIPLREATPSGTRVEFARPRFAAKFRAGFTLPSVSEAFYSIQQNIQFSEAF
ncbi:hypothetical protein SAMN03159496_04626 [Rhizobium sp. NFR07]|uniref:hypothetical protein n=1 Tax=Rhizobium sp. NFR07 TaxID=1566262 RepID=UPI0008DFC1DC|nr:hypothetical protein [Rhizobium sp. NFR07]SFB52253.1 hypothetical protein SAMN03159496_04626 [Rhizobium sp. NFR07]